MILWDIAMLPRSSSNYVNRLYDLPQGSLWVQSNFPISGREPVRVSHATHAGPWLYHHLPVTRSNTQCIDWCIEKNGEVLACANDMADFYHGAAITNDFRTGDRMERLFPEFGHEGHEFLTHEKWGKIVESEYPFWVQTIEDAVTYHGKPFRRLLGTYIYLPNDDYVFNATVAVFDDTPVEIGDKCAIKRKHVYWDLVSHWDVAVETRRFVEWGFDKNGCYQAKG